MSYDPINTTAAEGAECRLCGEDATGHDVIHGEPVPTCDLCHIRRGEDPDAPWRVPPVSRGINQAYRESVTARGIADVCAQLATQMSLAQLDVADRAWLHTVADEFVNDVIAYFDGVNEGGKR